MSANPLLAPWTGRFGLPPFADIRAEHFAPALREAMARHLADIEAIAAQAAPPTFENTIAALDCAGRGFERICALFYNLTSRRSRHRPRRRPSRTRSPRSTAPAAGSSGSAPCSTT